jgi:MFS family permease
MLLNVREGQYPPPPAYVGGKSGPIAAISTYARECHSLTHYWYQWMNSFVGSIGGGIGVFTLLFYTKAIGLSLPQIGYLNGTISVTVAVMILGSGWLADRYHPIRVVLAGVIFSSLIVTPASLIWLFWHPASRIAFWVCMAMGVGLTAPSTALVGVWDPPLFMRFFPRDRYGQFCSTNAVWRACGGILGGFVAGKFLDIVSKWVGPDKAYFYIPVWNLAFAIPGIVLFWFMYRSWKRYGGDNYVPPVLTPISTGVGVIPGPINVQVALA